MLSSVRKASALSCFLLKKSSRKYSIIALSVTYTSLTSIIPVGIPHPSDIENQVHHAPINDFQRNSQEYIY